jgi:hypothetical protein
MFCNSLIERTVGNLEPRLDWDRFRLVVSQKAWEDHQLPAPRSSPNEREQPPNCGYSGGPGSLNAIGERAIPRPQVGKSSTRSLETAAFTIAIGIGGA